MRRYATRIHRGDLLTMRRQAKRRLMTRAEAYQVKNELRRLAY
jgi:hypothetical protein